MFIIATIICTRSESKINVSHRFSSVPIHYNLNLTIPNIEKEESNDVKTINEHTVVSFNGESKIIINILHPMSLIILQDAYSRITSAKLITRNNISYQIIKYIYIDSNYLGIHFSDELLPGFYTLKMEFIGKTTHNNVEGFFTNCHINKDGVIE